MDTPPIPLNTTFDYSSEFAHVSDPIDFDNENIKNRCKNLKHQTLPMDSNAKEMFTRSVLGVLAMIHIHEITAKRPKMPKDINLQNFVNFEDMIRNEAETLFKEIDAEQKV